LCCRQRTQGIDYGVCVSVGSVSVPDGAGEIPVPLVLPFVCAQTVRP
jgi:hypothetical protein